MASDKERRAKSDALKRERGLYKPSVWVHRDNGSALAEIARLLEKPANVEIRWRGSKITVIIDCLNPL